MRDPLKREDRLSRPHQVYGPNLGPNPSKSGEIKYNFTTHTTNNLNAAKIRPVMQFGTTS